MQTRPLTVLYAKTGSPLFKGDLFVLVSVALLEKAGGAVFHRHQRDSKWSELRVRQEPGGQDRLRPQAESGPTDVFNLLTIQFNPTLFIDSL